MAEETGSNGDTPVLPVGKAAVDRLIQENSHLFTDGHCKVCSAVLISESQKLAHYQSKKHANKVRRYMSIHSEEEELAPEKKIKLIDKESSNGNEDRNKCCPICNMTFSSPVVAQSHYEGKTHSRNLKIKEQGPYGEAISQLKNPTNSAAAFVPSKNEELLDTTDPDKFCRLCHATFNNPLMAKQHYVGKKHKKQETKLKLMTQFSSSSSTAAGSSSSTSPSPSTTVPSSLAGKGYPCEICDIVLNSIEQYQAHVSGSKHKNCLKSKLPGGLPQQEGAEQHHYEQQQQPYIAEEVTGPEGYSCFSEDQEF
ncbi:zinc finger protein 346 [Microcaecilia unicolor]|uniref:Zinc finger protein 346 n=1 Tax=Microcaecilia unicolor TaxID=1415580 RepID=A0A6P7YJ80_9AMPH|nr:zinc finger protein 346 [Microcaecilia unicolor]